MADKPTIVFMPHGNLQYSQLPPERRGWVARRSYRSIFTTARELGVPIAFEASGETLEIMERESPEVLDLLAAGVGEGWIEPVGSPRTHIMVSNVPPSVALDSLKDGLDVWERLTGVRPVTAWNPECSWSPHVPDIFRDAGVETLIADADSYLLSSVEGLRETTGLRFDVRGHSNKNALFRIEEAIAGRPEALLHLFRPNILPNGLKVLLRSDMLCNIMLWYLMGATEGNREEPVGREEVAAVLKRWRDRMPGGEGVLVPYAEDAEYVGTTAYFYVKQFGQARFFEDAPRSIHRFRHLLSTALELGFEPITPAAAVRRYEAVEGVGFDRIVSGCAWHGGTAKAWANTVYSRILDPVCAAVHDGLRRVAAECGVRDLRHDEATHRVLQDVTTGWVSDARWPPAPTSPGRFNVTEALDALERANAGLCRLMTDRGLAAKQSLYSPELMDTQLAAVREELMAMPYFGEPAGSPRPVPGREHRIPLLEGERWWGGLAKHGPLMPFGGDRDYACDLYGDLEGNQAAPLLLSSRGRYVWSEEPFAFAFTDGRLTITGARAEVVVEEGHGSLRGAYRAAARTHFPASGVRPPDIAFTAPQYNIWMDMERYPTQKKVLTYAREVLASGLPPGVLIIDDFWHVANGVWEWNPVSFPDPRDMIRSLHEMGFPVMLWVCPYICADSRRYWELREKGFLLRNPAADPDDPNGMAIKKWWNGYSAIFDVSNPEAMDWLRRRLRSLVEEYGVDGFKFDGGDAQAYIGLDTMGAVPGTPNSRCEAYARLGEEFALSEYRACWKRGGKRQIQRIGDKAHAWGDNGLADIVPISIAQGLLGYPYVCPDMVGGGDVEVRNGLDQELFVRWAQVAMFWPIVQYSKLPGRILDEEHRKAMTAVYALREELAPEMLRLADEAQRSGEPILRPMGYAFPEENMESVTDQFMVGERIMAAPVLRKGARSRTVRFPSGTWTAPDGRSIEGPAEQRVEAPLGFIPWYRRTGQGRTGRRGVS